jgi:hypothetical protein
VFKNITPHDSNEQPGLPGQVYVGVSGDVAVMGELGGDVVVLKSHPVGYIPGRVARVYATDTTSTNLIAMNS